MDAKTIRAISAMFLSAIALLARNAHAAPLDKPPKPAKPPHSVACTITGTNGPDVILGSAGDDVICGLAGNDRIIALGGNDVVNGGAGRDVIDGGPGSDTLIGGAGNDEFDARDGTTDTIDGGTGGDRATVDRGVDSVANVERVRAR